MMNATHSPPPPASSSSAAEVRFGFVPLTDAAPLIIAQARGFFARQGIHATLRRVGSWTALRDSLDSGAIHAAQMLFGMPLASACGALGNQQKALVVPWVLNRGGQGITVASRWKGIVSSDARAFREAAVAGRDKGRPLVFGHTLRVGTHAMWMRYWLAAGGIDPDRDVVLITVPPPQMVANLRAARMDGACVGEPWNARAIADGLGFTALTSQEIWPDHPEKVCAFTEEFANERADTVVAVLKALRLAGRWLDDPANRHEAAVLLSAPEYLNCAPALIESRLGTSFEYGDGRVASLPEGVNFSSRGANRPVAAHALWYLSQLRRWGLVYGTPDYTGIVTRVLRPDLYERALAELGESGADAVGELVLPAAGAAFDPADPESYARQFPIHNLQG